MAEFLHGFPLMGNDIELSIDHPDATQIFQEAEALLRDYERRYSANFENSELMAINAAAGRSPVTVSNDLYDLIKNGVSIALATNGVFNIAVGAITKLWHIGFSDAQLPDKAQIQEKLALIHPKDIELNDEQRSVFLKKTGMELDLGAIAKGYFADRLKQFFTEKGVHSGLISLGTTMVTIGQANDSLDGFWTVEIPNPLRYDGQVLAHLKTSDQSVVISSINERKLKVGDKYYHHIFDTRTGYPVDSRIAGIVIVSEQALDGEIWSTVLFGLPAEKALRWMNQEESIEGMIVTKEGQVIVSEGLQDKLILCQDFEMLG